jgi:microcystin-dependent protein
MALVDSNTFTEPTAGTSLNAARGQVNNSLRSLLTNFRSTSSPSTLNLTADGDNIGAQNGMLYHHANNNVNALYISDSSTVKDAPVGGNFTRAGIGVRIENGIVPMMSNVTHYEIGELVVTTTADSGTAANARLYLNKSNNNTPADFIDVGIPPTNGSVVNTMIAISGVTGDRVNFAFDEITSSPGNRQNAHLKVGASGAASNTSILIGSQNTTSNVSIVKLHGGIAEDAGISIFDQNNKYAPVSANLISQATIQGTDTDVAPLMPAGSVIAWAGASAPAGWLQADGSAINRTTYAALFAVCGTAFGNGDGSSTFNIPNLDDRVIIGDGANNTRGQQTGALAASSKTTTDSAAASPVVGTIEVSTGAKDAGGVTVVNSVTGGGHTHTATIPSVCMYYIIKT